MNVLLIMILVLFVGLIRKLYSISRLFQWYLKNKYNFPRLGYTGIWKIFDQAKINYQKQTIIQASNLKESLANLRINR